MNLLVIENSSKNLSIAIKKEDKIFEENNFSNKSSQYIISTINALLNRAKINIADIDAFSLGLGPGSFTGLRVACSTIKGFHTGLKKPILGVRSFVAIAEEFSFLDKPTSIIFDAGKNLIYAAIYKKIKEKIKPEVFEKLMDLEDFLRKFCNKECIFVGESIKFKDKIRKRYPQALISGEVSYPQARFLIKESEEKYFKKDFIDIEKLEPLYLHPETCQIRK